MTQQSTRDQSTHARATVACRLSDLTEDQPIHVEVDGEPVLLVRTAGEVHALRDVCSHAEVALSEGDIEDCQVECWLHGSAFDLRTGEPSSLPATTPVPVYTARVEGDDVLVTLAPPAGHPAPDRKDTI